MRGSAAPWFWCPEFDAQTVVDGLARHRCTIFSGVPTMYCALLQADTDGRDLSALRVGVSREATVPGEVIRAFEEKFPGVVIIGVSGLSETAPAATFNISAEQRKVLSIGKSIWKVAAWVVELPPGADYVERTTGYCVFAAVLLLSVGVLPWREEKYFRRST